MCTNIWKVLLFILLLDQKCFIVESSGFKQNKSAHHVRRANVDDFFKNKILSSYRSFQPVSVKYHKSSYPRADDRPDYDITSYDSEYGGVVSNFTSSIYDDIPPLYPNPEFVARTNEVISKTENKPPDSEIDLPDDSLADADLKEHNIIDSVTYLYGFNNCHGVRNEWMILKKYIYLEYVTGQAFNIYIHAANIFSNWGRNLILCPYSPHPPTPYLIIFNCFILIF
ncbi:unnamed protein product [Diatraea saccharalis]|uniref:Uncharacterized protein n=1 Tax=Diatraea saccharalis TaxID=40085 RepID=A0A9N9WET5_9NEOP|nr:unnamed protein product [Diatraea saccharalis]